MSRLEGKVAIITGGARGLGEACARLFVANGAKVIIADIRDDLGTTVAASLGASASYFHCNVCEEREVSELVIQAVSRHGRLDIMLNNAGIAFKGAAPLADLDMDDFDEVMRVNVRGTLLGVKHAAKVMIPQKSGCILCTASVAGVVATGKCPPYTISKHAALGLVKEAATELGKQGVRVNAISPFAVMTPLFIEGTRERFAERNLSWEAIVDAVERNSVLQGVHLQADDIAQAALFLASDEASFINGHNLVIDGGFSVTKRVELLHLH